MDADHVTSRPIMWKFPAHPPTTAIIGDSQVKYVHQHFDPADQHSPAFISQPGATILSATHLLDFVPRGVTRLILHLGTNDLATTGVSSALARYRNLLGLIRERRPDILHVYATLVLPRSPNRRRGSSNRGFVARFNGRARAFNGRLRGLCHQERDTYFLDHCLDQLPRRMAMAADGLHLSFCGVSYLAWNVHRLLARCRRRTTDVWRDHAASLEPAVDTCMLPAADPHRVTASSDDLPSTGNRPLVLTHERDSDLAGDRPTAATLTPADPHRGATSSDDFPSVCSQSPVSAHQRDSDFTGDRPAAATLPRSTDVPEYRGHDSGSAPAGNVAATPGIRTHYNLRKTFSAALCSTEV
ncbi:hypothetical protein HPB47_014402 [Ixodes persulcatus]|uniref:Uncharacterized protein n=1 Tax=Ixodes persulcatus TaxID=34615 RepID=A0AC60QW34_IXOPE|nr:hypothetical protein HPB47_014402 [Ixodes persulcatus]